MENDLTTHFKSLDYHKDLLFNVTTLDQEQRIRRIIEGELEREKYLNIRKELSKNKHKHVVR